MDEALALPVVLAAARLAVVLDVAADVPVEAAALLAGVELARALLLTDVAALLVPERLLVAGALLLTDAGALLLVAGALLADAALLVAGALLAVVELPLVVLVPLVVVVPHAASTPAPARARE